MPLNCPIFALGGAQNVKIARRQTHGTHDIFFVPPLDFTLPIVPSLNPTFAHAPLSANVHPKARALCVVKAGFT